MAKYAISAEGAAALKKLAFNLNITAENIIALSAMLENKIIGYSDSLGIYADEILSLTLKNKNTIMQNRALIREMSSRITALAGEIEQMCSPYAGIRVGNSGSSTNSFDRAMGLGELAVPTRSALSEDLISMFPEGRREAMHASYSKAPEKITSIINRCSLSLANICESGYGRDELGRLVKNGCFYSPDGKCIAMNEELNDAEYADVFKHEVGHFADDIMGKVSSSPEFISAMDSAASKFDSNTPEGRQRLSDMLDDAFNTGACNDRNVTDIISALLINDPTVERRFFSESQSGYIANYKHDNRYWFELDDKGESRNTRGSEIFANLFAIETDQYRISKNFVERWFSEITDVFSTYIC